jgi:hypothetical protein
MHRSSPNCQIDTTFSIDEILTDGRIYRRLWIGWHSALWQFPDLLRKRRSAKWCSLPNFGTELCKIWPRLETIRDLLKVYRKAPRIDWDTTISYTCFDMFAFMLFLRGRLAFINFFRAAANIFRSILISGWKICVGRQYVTTSNGKDAPVRTFYEIFQLEALRRWNLKWQIYARTAKKEKPENRNGLQNWTQFN